MRKATGGQFDLARDFGCAGRRIVLVDVENLLGRRYITRSCAAWACSKLTDFLGLTEVDQVVVGTSHVENLVATSHGWTEARQVFLPGQDGADRALLEVLTEGVGGRFTEVVVVSGDHIFAEPLAALASRGIKSTVIARSGRLSRRLRMAAHRVVCPQFEFFGPVLEGRAA